MLEVIVGQSRAETPKQKMANGAGKSIRESSFKKGDGCHVWLNSAAGAGGFVRIRSPYEIPPNRDIETSTRMRVNSTPPPPSQNKKTVAASDNEKHRYKLVKRPRFETSTENGIVKRDNATVNQHGSGSLLHPLCEKWGGFPVISIYEIS